MTRPDKYSCRELSALCVLFVLGVPAAAHANGASPLILLTMFHLFLGNAAIGIIEGLILAFVFKTPKLRSVLWLILANYLSMFAGMFALGIFGGLASPTIYTLLPFVICAFIFLFLLTVVIEFPFVLFCFEKSARPMGRVIRATLLLQVISYALITPFYSFNSQGDLLTSFTLSPPGSFASSPAALVYYVAQDRKTVKRCRLDGTGAEPVATLQQDFQHGQHLFCHRSDDSTSWDLYCYTSSYAHTPPYQVTRDIAVYAIDNYPESVSHAAGLRWPRPDYRKADERDWEIYAGQVRFSAHRATDKQSAADVRLSHHTPFAAWDMHPPTPLPDDQVVFQWGDQICLLDLNTRELGLIARGLSPVVVFDRPPEDSTAIPLEE
ncbi:hypothetical protein ACFL34_00880 [Candidatus Sumerlaeota bacterium]